MYCVLITYFIIIDWTDSDFNSKTASQETKTLLRNETASSLESRIIGDEREEIIEANKTQTMLTRFFTNRNLDDDFVASRQNFAYSTNFPNSGKFCNQINFNEFKTNNTNK